LSGSAFQVLAAATGNAGIPMVDSVKDKNKMQEK